MKELLGGHGAAASEANVSTASADVSAAKADTSAGSIDQSEVKETASENSDHEASSEK